MSKYNELNARIKSFYEEPVKTRLTRKIPVILRMDGKAFHTFTRGFKKPFDPIMRETMMETMKALCENIQGCVFGYEQSDEITLVLTDFENENSSAWLDYETQKMCSIAASMTTLYFNKIFSEKVKNLCNSNEEDEKYIDTMMTAVEKGAMFDARCFSVPKLSVYDVILARQIDASKNSISSVGRTYFSTSELRNKNTSKVQDMLMMYHGVNWNNFATEEKRGSCCYKVEKKIESPNASEGFVMRNKWIIDKNMPLLKETKDPAQRSYIEKFIY